MPNEREPCDWSFRPEMLRAPRPSGISGFMRIRNGAEFLEATIRSHIGYFDEIVAVYNQCTDRTPQILYRLQREFGPKLRIYHYLPQVYPPGSTGHASEPADSPRSFVSQSNYALALTRFSVASKLDDDHLAMDSIGPLTAEIRRRGCRLDEVQCVSGINIALDENGQIGVPVIEPFVGSGDQGYFQVTPETYFRHDPRFERLAYGSAPRKFAGFTYWHLKYLKTGFGFANRDIESGANPRFERKLRAFAANRSVSSTAELRSRARMNALLFSFLSVSAKFELLAERDRSFCRSDPDDYSVVSAWRAATGGLSLESRAIPSRVTVAKTVPSPL